MKPVCINGWWVLPLELQLWHVTQAQLAVVKRSLDQYFSRRFVKTIFFVDDDDRLVRSDPRQTRMFEGEKP